MCIRDRDERGQRPVVASGARLYGVASHVAGAGRREQQVGEGSPPQVVRAERQPHGQTLDVVALPGQAQAPRPAHPHGQVAGRIQVRHAGRAAVQPQLARARDAQVVQGLSLIHICARGGRAAGGEDPLAGQGRDLSLIHI